MDSSPDYCESYCKHGGACTLPPHGPEVSHNSGYCKWDASESVSKEVANEILRRNGVPDGVIDWL
jgi:hypothetical protein